MRNKYVQGDKAQCQVIATNGDNRVNCIGSLMVVVVQYLRF